MQLSRAHTLSPFEALRCKSMGTDLTDGLRNGEEDRLGFGT